MNSEQTRKLMSSCYSQLNEHDQKIFTEYIHTYCQKINHELTEHEQEIINTHKFSLSFIINMIRNNEYDV